MAILYVNVNVHELPKHRNRDEMATSEMPIPQEAASEMAADPARCGAFKLSSFGQLVGPSRFSAGPLQEVMRQPGAHVLAQGVPPMASLPIVGVKITLADGTVIEIDKAESLTSQRYAPFGWSSLRSWLVEHVRQQHAPPAEDWDVGITSGSMYALDAVLRQLVDPGDAVLCEEYTFLATKDLLHCLRADIVPLAMDADGLLPSGGLPARLDGDVDVVIRQQFEQVLVRSEVDNGALTIVFNHLGGAAIR